MHILDGPAMTVPGALYLECPTCGEVTLHEVVHGTSTGRSLVVDAKCRGCGTVSHQTVRSAEVLRLPIVVSDRGTSRRTTIEAEGDEVIAVDDELMVEGLPVRVRSIEVGHEQRVQEAPGSSIKTIWAVRFDSVRVKMSINVGPRTKMAEVEAAPDEEFTVGDMVEAAGTTSVVHSIKTRTGSVRRGSVQAQDIVRVYCRAVRGLR
jgi:uncharacterized Zn finger protein